MKLPKILVHGKFTPEDLVVTIGESNRKIDAVVESKLEKVWQEKVIHAQETGKNLYNGQSYRLNTIVQKDKKLVLEFAVFDFKTRDGLIAIPEYFDLPEEYYRKGCFAVSSVRTSDNKYIMAELSGKSMNPNRFENIGGVMESNIPMVSGESVFRCLYTEFEEEISVRLEDIVECYLQTIFLADKTNVAFYFETILNISSDELLERFKNNTDPDIKSLCIYTREEYLDALANHSSLNKQFTVGLLSI